jgi:hypothetical protein
VAGAIAAAGFYVLGRYLFDGEVTCGRPFAMTAVPLVLGVLTAATFVFIGLASAEMADEDLEWWGRVGSCVLIVGVGWLVLTALVYYGPGALRVLRGYIEHTVPGVATHERADGAIGLFTSALGGISAYLARTQTADKPGESPLAKRLVMALAAPVFVVLLFASWPGSTRKCWRQSSSARQHHDPARFVQANYLVRSFFSLRCSWGLVCSPARSCRQPILVAWHIRQRLIRAFLGASRPAGRPPNPFTGFDPPMTSGVRPRRSAPILVVNMTLVVARPRACAASQSRTVHSKPALRRRAVARLSADQCVEQARSARDVARHRDGDFRAAPHPNDRSAPAPTFLLTLFNARLGAWLGNPGPRGERTWRYNEPQQDAVPLIREMLGRTGSASPHVYLSDGGHCENLGLYQMLLRRTRYILVSDAASDEDYIFEDLARAIRLARIDLGISVVFEQPVSFDREHHGRGNAHVAVGRILYSEVDGPAAEDGILIHVKATLSGDEPLDVINYGKAHPAFPHESTANQWFDEAQFESYRMLGYHSIARVTAGYRGPSQCPTSSNGSRADASRASLPQTPSAVQPLET